jgi:uncharacterized protein YabN with tetrapyrrole methylase and pyrophosphatase domain
VLVKLREEIGELEEAVAKGERSEIEAEIGDVLFVAVNIARFVGVDCEEALRGMLDRFARRFKRIEEEAAVRGRNIQDMTLDEMDAVWEQAKSRE